MRPAPEMDVRIIDEWHKGAIVGGVGHEPVRDDDLMRGIHRDLAVVALHEAVARGQDAAVGIGEVALRAIRWAAVLAPQGPTLPAHAR